MKYRTSRLSKISKHLLQKDFNNIHNNLSTEEFSFKSCNNRVIVNSALSVLTSGILSKLNQSKSDLTTENRFYFSAKSLNISNEINVNKERMVVVSRRSGKNNFSAVNYKRFGLNKESIYNIFNDMHNDNIFLNEKFYKNVIGVRSYSNFQKAYKSYPEYKIVLSNITKFIDRAIFEVANDTAKDLLSCYTPNSYGIHKYVDNFRHKSDNRLVESKRLFLDVWDAIDDYSADWYSKWNDYNLSPQGFNNLVNTSKTLTNIRNYELFYGLKYYGEQLSKQIWLLRTGKNSHLNTIFGSATRISFLRTISKTYLERDYTVAAKKNFGLLRSMFLKTWFPASGAEASVDYLNFNPFYLACTNPFSSQVKKNTDKFTDNSKPYSPKLLRITADNDLNISFSAPIRLFIQKKSSSSKITKLVRHVSCLKYTSRRFNIKLKLKKNYKKSKFVKKVYSKKSILRWRLNADKYKTLLLNALTLSVREDRIPDLTNTDDVIHGNFGTISRDSVNAKNDTMFNISSYSKLAAYGSVSSDLPPQINPFDTTSVYGFVHLERLLVSDFSSTSSISKVYSRFLHRSSKQNPLAERINTIRTVKSTKCKFSPKLLLGMLHSLSVVRNKFTESHPIRNLISYNFIKVNRSQVNYLSYSNVQLISTSRFTAIFTNYYLQRNIRKINRKSNTIAVKPLYPNYILERAFAANVDFNRFTDKFLDVVVEINDSMQKAGYTYNPVLKYLFYKAMLGRFRALPISVGSTTDTTKKYSSTSLNKDLFLDQTNIKSTQSSKIIQDLTSSVNKVINSPDIVTDNKVQPRVVSGSQSKISTFIAISELPRLLDVRYKYLFSRSRKLFMLKNIDIIKAKRDVVTWLLDIQSGAVRLGNEKNKAMFSAIKRNSNFVNIHRCLNVAFLDNFLNPYIDNIMHYRVDSTISSSKYSKILSNRLSMLFIAKRLTRLVDHSVDKKNLFLKNMRFNFLHKVSQQSTFRELYFDKYIQKQQNNLIQPSVSNPPSVNVMNRQVAMLNPTDSVVFNRLNPKAIKFFNNIDYPTTQVFLNKWKEYHIGGLQTFLNYEFLRLIPDEAKNIAANSDCVLDRALLPIYRSRKTHSRVLKSFYFNNESWFKNPKHNFMSQSHTQFYNRKYPDFWYKPGRKKYPLKRGKKNWAIKIPLASRTNANKGRLLNSFYDSSLTYLRFIGWHSWTRNTKRLKSLESLYRYGRDGDPFARSPLADIWSTTYQIGDLTKYDSFIMARPHANTPILITTYHGHANNPDLSVNLSHNFRNAYRGYNHNRVISSVKHLHFNFRSYNEGFKTWFKRIKPIHAYSGIKTYYQYQSYLMQKNNEVKSRRYKTIFSSFAFAFRLNKTLFSKNLVTLNFFDFANSVNSLTGYDLCTMHRESTGLDTINSVLYKSIMSKYKYRPVFTTNTTPRAKLGSTPDSLVRVCRSFNKRYGSLLSDYAVVLPRNTSKSVIDSDSRLRFINRINKSSIALNNYIKKMDIKNSLATITAKNALWW